MGWRDWPLWNRLDRIEDVHLFLEPVLDPEEDIVWSLRANRDQRGRAVGGKLFVTNQRVVFVPHRFERRIRGREWSCPLDDVEEVGVKERGWNPFSGAFRRRLRITAAGTDQAFAVDDAAGRAAELGRLLSR